VAQQEKDINLVLIADNPGCAVTLRDALEVKGINGTIRRVAPGLRAVDCARHTGKFSDTEVPDLIIFDFAEPDDKTSAILNKIAFCEDKPDVPVVLLTSNESQELLDAGGVGDDKAIMFSPTSLSSFVGKLKNGHRDTFFGALRTLYSYGPILVSMPPQTAH
jgi:response regulator RpfG family c-di-GMP phosphodiesterase